MKNMKSSKKRGIFITFEGPEGCGKSTHSALLAKYLTRKNIPVVSTREPGGTIIAELLRKIILNPEHKISDIAELFLYEAARAEHINDIVLPALEKGKTVICDRFTDATIAYQGYGRGLDIKTIEKLNDIASQGFVPDLTVLLDIPVSKGLKKAKNIRKDFAVSGDRLEREGIAFHERVRRGYLKTAGKYPKRIKIVRTEKDILKTQKKIQRIVEDYLR